MKEAFILYNKYSFFNIDSFFVNDLIQWSILMISYSDNFRFTFIIQEQRKMKYFLLVGNRISKHAFQLCACAYIYRKRERERESEEYMWINIYIYIYI